MKLSDINDLHKMAKEFKQLEELLEFIRNFEIGTITITCSGRNTRGSTYVDRELVWGGQHTVPMHEFEIKMYEALEAVQDEIKAKLVMCGVDNFSD